MKRIAFRVVLALVVVAAGLAWGWSPQVSGQSVGQPSTDKGDWPSYTADMGKKLPPRDASNFSKMEVAWRFKTDNLGPRPETKLEGTPLMVKGTLYATAGTRRAVDALDGKTGEQKWVYSDGRGRARHALGAASALGPRPVLLDRRQGRRAHPLRHDRLSPRRAERQERPADRRASATTASSISSRAS